MLNVLIPWSLHNYSELPWRKKRSLYNTLVSEIMLQQTTVSTVIPKFKEFTKEYPNLKKLSESSEEEILIAWKGLGYYRRARNLRLASKQLIKEFKGKFPKDKLELLKIKGIGEYTSSAICSLGHKQDYLAIDSNLERVLSRLYMIKQNKGLALQKEIANLYNSKEILKTKESYPSFQINEALMDLGRTYCHVKNPKCSSCPIKDHCLAYSKDVVENYPNVSLKKKVNKFQVDLLKCVVLKGDKVLAVKRNNKQWLSGQWDLPTFVLKSEDKLLKQYPWAVYKKKELFSLSSTITKYKFNNKVVQLTQKQCTQMSKEENNFQWINLQEKNFTSTSIKILDKIKNREER